MVVWVVVGEGEVFELEVEDTLDFGIDVHLWQLTRLACELQTCLLEMIEVEVGVACCIDEVACFEACHLCHHHEQKAVGCDVEWYSQEGVCATLVEL